MHRDIIFAVRQLRTNLKFTTIVVVTLALGIGAATATFSLVNGVLLRPLAFRESSRLVSLETVEFPREEEAIRDLSGGTLSASSYLDFVDWRTQSRSFEAIAACAGSSRKFNPPNDGRSRIVNGAAVSAGFFEVLGVKPILGRTFTMDDEQPGKRSVIISQELWASDFRSSVGIIGSRATLSDTAFTVVGVIPADFRFPYSNTPALYWEVLSRERYGGRGWTAPQRGDRAIQVLARLKAGKKIAQARAEMNTIQRRLAQDYPEDRYDSGVAVKPLLEYLTGDVRKPLYLLFASVTAILLIACVNVAGLMLARGFMRRSEFEVRVALGAKPSHVIRQVLIECSLLASCAGVVGIAVAFLVLKLTLAFAPVDLPRLGQVRIDAPVLAFAFLIALLTGIVFGVVPAWKASRSDSSSIGRGGRGIRGSHSEQRLHAGLVIVETAISLVLLAASGLLIHSFVETVHVHPGFDPHHVLTLRLGMTSVEYSKAKRNAFFRELLPAIATIPGVQSVSGGNLPSDYDQADQFTIAGRPVDAGEIPLATANLVEPGYFQTLRIPLLQGRLFDDRDGAKGKPVVIVNEALASKFFPSGGAVGKYIQPDLGEGDRWNTWCEIVGIVGNVRGLGLTDPPGPQFYLAYEQDSSTWPQPVIVRVSGDPHAYVSAVRAMVDVFDRGLPISETHTLDELIASSTSSARFETQLLTSFAGCAVLLAALGLYAALSEMVARRTFEIGLRVALGAQRSDVFRLVMGRGVLLAMIGLMLGFGGFALTVRFLADMLYGVHPFDPLSLLGVSAFLLFVSLAASAAPALRAARLEPTNALREP